jgi:hypothetical protein
MSLFSRRSWKQVLWFEQKLFFAIHTTKKEGDVMAKQQKATGGSSTTRESTEDEIRSLAYQLYCEGGYQNGRDVEHWLEAEQQVMVRRKAHLRKVL